MIARNALSLVLLTVGLLPVQRGLAQDPDAADAQRWIERLTISGGDPLDVRFFTNRPAVKDLIIADRSQIPILESVLTGAAHWTAKASALYILVQSNLHRFIPREVYDNLFSDPSVELKAFSALVISMSLTCGYSPDDPALKWIEEREASGDGVVDRAYRILAAPPEFTHEEAERRIANLIPLLTEKQNLNVVSSGRVEWVRAAGLLGAMGDRSVSAMRDILTQAQPDPIKARALIVLGRTKSASAALILRSTLQSPSEYLRVNALGAYAECVGHVAIPDLMYMAASDPSEYVRDWAKSELGRLEGRQESGSSEPMIAHPTPGERLEAEREKWLEQTRKDQAAWLQRIQDARGDAERREQSNQPTSLSASTSRSGSVEENTSRSIVVLAIACIGTATAVFVAWRLYALRKTAALK